ncbi:Replication protein A subunit [Quillaja saponaria]|uniref:Replication protein A subunit n=1 Tax=Quillaja saponaria TaxID=32244 RepID=A0AAD7KS42_QUISA|nr:Replication protein A subunit [Quillaja saponaria]
MAVKLTEGAIAMMCREETISDDVKPVVQVTDLRLLQQPQQRSTTERYRLVISDGSHSQQGMLATQKNDLVSSGKLQKGSIVQLNSFVCNVVQNRRIVIVMELDVILETCDIIGEPLPVQKAVPVQSSTGQPGIVAGNPQPLSGSAPLGRPNMSAASLDYPRMNQQHGGVYSGNSEAGRYGASNVPPTFPKGESGAAFQQHSSVYSGNSDPGRYGASNVPHTFPKAEPGASFPKSVPLSGSYGDQNMGYRNPQAEPSRMPLNTYARAPQPAYRQPSPVYNNRGPIAKNEAPPRIIPIAALNPYQNTWTIKARVTAKGELRHYNNARGDGRVFSFDLLDSDGGEIRATCFNAVADMFYNQIEAGKVYLISRGSLKPAQKNFNHLRNDQELMLDTTTIIQPCFDDDNSIPRQQFHFRSIGDVETMENNSVVDFIGVVSFISPTTSIMRKNGTETQKRTLHLKDMSGRSVEVTLWGNFCNAEGQRLQTICDSGASPILAVKSGRVNDFNGKSVGTIATSQLFIEPDFPEAHRLKEWFDKEGRNTQSISISRETSTVGRADVRKTISQIKDEKLGTSEKPDWISVSASLSYIKFDNFCYTACPIMIGDRQCNKKVTNNGDGKWRCDRCDQSVDACDYRYILQLQIQDHTGLTWVTAFQECGEEILGIPAKDLYYLKYEEQDDERFAEIIRKVLFTKFIFKLKIKEETFSDEQRVKSTVVKAEKVNFSSESRFLLDLIDMLKAGKAESVIPNSVMNSAAVGNVGSRQASREYAIPANQVGSYGNPYNSSITASGAPSSYLTCNNCGGTGHSSANCSSSRSGLGQSTGGGYTNRVSSGPGVSGTSGECYKCHQTGHWARDCPKLSSIPPAYGSSGVMSGRC